MRATRRSSRRPITLSLILLLAIPSGMTLAEDTDVTASVARIFAAHANDAFVAVVLDDTERRRYLAFYMSAYLDLRELRAYLIPYASAERDVVDVALAAGDHATAFTSLLSSMRVSRGAQYVSDVNLDGIREEVVTLGQGTIRDGFHHEIFADHATADAAYKHWLSIAVGLLDGS